MTSTSSRTEAIYGKSQLTVKKSYIQHIFMPCMSKYIVIYGFSIKLTTIVIQQGLLAEELEELEALLNIS